MARSRAPCACVAPLPHRLEWRPGPGDGQVGEPPRCSGGRARGRPGWLVRELCGPRGRGGPAASEAVRGSSSPGAAAHPWLRAGPRHRSSRRRPSQVLATGDDPVETAVEGRRSRWGARGPQGTPRAPAPVEIVPPPTLLRLRGEVPSEGATGPARPAPLGRPLCRIAKLGLRGRGPRAARATPGWT